jgi:4-amino-4-deoxy-L-arabinose transferase-like glycosyltransferase
MTVHTPSAPPPSTPSSATSSGAEPGEWLVTKRHSWRNASLDRIGLGVLLLGTGLLYVIGLSASGWANQYYSAAALAGSKSWTAFLFGSLDSSNYITVDKPPASLWVMDVSVRIFGLNSWSILVPQALEGVAAVALLYMAVKRVSSPAAGLFAGAILATTPVATLMFRFNNPDALLVLLMTGAAYATVRAIEAARGRWLALAGVLLGFAFLTKMLQGFLVVPAFALAYLIAAPTTLRRRLLHLLVAGLAMFAAAGWWVAVVELWPAGSRPYVGGSNHNSVLELIFGYNGLGRLDGSSNNGNVAGGAGGFSSGQTGLTRLFGDEMGAQISWLLPAALLGMVALAWLCRRAPRTDRLRASLIVWGGWIVCTGLVLSLASGIIHPYYVVALAPGIAAVVALASVALWRARDMSRARWLLAALIALAAWWTIELLGRAPDWHPWLRWVVAASGIAAAIAVLSPRVRTGVVAILVAATMLVAPAAYSVETAETAHTGSLPTAGPSSGFGGFGGARPSGGPGGFLGGFPGGGFPGTGRGTFPGASGQGNPPTDVPLSGSNQGGTPPGTGTPGARMPGGLDGVTSVGTALVKALQDDAGSYTWVAATVSANNAASLELASGDPVMALGGFNGSDPAMTLARFQQLVAAGKIHYFVADQQGFIGSTAGSTTDAYAIQRWVANHHTARTIGGSTVYDLTGTR